MRNGKVSGFLGLCLLAAGGAVTNDANFDQSASFEVAQATSPNVSGEGSGMAQKPGKADEPKQFQPVNPAPDPRIAPTNSTSGVGASSGGRPEQQAPAK